MGNGESANSELNATPEAGRPTPAAPVWHTVVLVAAVVGLSILSGIGARMAARSGPLPNRMTQYILTVAYEFVLLGYVWLIKFLQYRVPLSEIIGGKWRKWGDFWRDVGVALLFWLVVVVVLLICSISLHFRGIDAAKALMPQTTRELIAFIVLAICAGFVEEIVFRGYLQRQFSAWTGSIEAGVVLQAIVFGSGHIYQGAKGVLVITIYGAMFGVLAAMRKSLRPGIMQHCAQDAFSGIVGHFLRNTKYMQIIRF